MSPPAGNHPEVRIVNPGGPLGLIMVIDDEDPVTLLAELVLSREGYSVVTARDGYQAVDIFRKLHERVSLVVLDYIMPGMDGAAVFKELRKIKPGLPVVFTSGFISPAKLDAILGEAGCSFFPKPLAPSKLLQNVRLALGSA